MTDIKREIQKEKSYTDIVKEYREKSDVGSPVTQSIRRE